MFCECTTDGFCPRYSREMGGRMRELCAGVNVDLGTAAAFREQWSRENHFKASASGKPMPLLLKTDQAPGDALAMTAAIYSLQKVHPERYVIAIESLWPEVFQHNPDITNNMKVGGVEEAFDFAQAAEIQMHYPAIHQSNERGIHFMQGWCEFLGMALGINIPLLTNRPRLYFADPAPPVEDYWLVCSGGKEDFTNKIWSRENYQHVVSALRGRIQFIQVGNNVARQEMLTGVKYMVGRTSLRELFGLARRAQGVLCGVSLLMHVAAALEKPAVVIAGGREPVAWNAYPKQHYLHTVGTLPCSDIKGNIGGACWRSRVVPLGDGTVLDKNTCCYPINGLPKCMGLITPEYVVDTILRVRDYNGIPKEPARQAEESHRYRSL